MTGVRCDPERFRDVVGRFASGVTVVTTAHAGADFGMTASAMCSLSLAPPMVLVCVNRRVPTRAAVGRSGVFAVNILDEDQAELAVRFATPHADKFAGVAVTRGPLGCPLVGGALAWLECRVAEDVAGGSHSVFFGEVEAADARDGNPLAYFRGEFGQLFSDGGRGAVIAPGAAAVDEALDARCAIELGAAELAVGRVDPAGLRELRAAMERTLPLIAHDRFLDVRAYADANARFHEALVALAGSPALLDAYRRLSLPGILVRGLDASSEAGAGLTTDHVAIVEAYEAGDLHAARAAIHRHTARTKDTHARAR